MNRLKEYNASISSINHSISVGSFLVFTLQPIYHFTYCSSMCAGGYAP